MSTPPIPFGKRAVYYISNLVIYSGIRLALLLPYETRLAFFSWLMRRFLGPVAGYRKRVIKNLELVWPDMPAAERKTITEATFDNFGRSFIENYSTDEFRQRMQSNVLTGEGVEPLRQAAADKRPVILASGHFGNPESVRSKLIDDGYQVGGLYRPMSNPYFDAHYAKTFEAYGMPTFTQGVGGTTGFVRHLKKGGQLILLYDRHVFEAPSFDFLGQPAQTATSAAELALRCDALLVPIYGIRRPDGLTFETVIEAPIAHTDKMTMTKALNDSLSARVQAHPGQWFWVHRRWRAEPET